MGCLSSSTLWFDAARDGDLEYIQQTAYINVNQQDFRNQIEQHFYHTFSAFHYASYFGQLAVVKFLIEYEYPCTTDQYLTLKLFKQNHTLVNITLPPRCTGLHVATVSSQWEILNFVLEELKTKQFYYRMLNSPRSYSILMLLILTCDSSVPTLIEAFWPQFLRSELLRASEVTVLQVAVSIGNIAMTRFILQLIASEGFHSTTILMAEHFDNLTDEQVNAVIDRTFGLSILKACSKGEIEACRKLVQNFMEGDFPAVPLWMGGPKRPDRILMRDYDLQFQSRPRTNSQGFDKPENDETNEYMVSIRKSTFGQISGSFHNLTKMLDEDLEAASQDNERERPKSLCMVSFAKDELEIEVTRSLDTVNDLGFAINKPVDNRNRVDSIAMYLSE